MGATVRRCPVERTEAMPFAVELHLNGVLRSSPERLSCVQSAPWPSGLGHSQVARVSEYSTYGGCVPFLLPSYWDPLVHGGRTQPLALPHWGKVDCFEQDNSTTDNDGHGSATGLRLWLPIRQTRGI